MCILEAFQNQQSMLLADKVLKQLGKEKAKEKYKVFVHFQTLSVFFAFIFTLNFFFFFFSQKHFNAEP